MSGSNRCLAAVRDVVSPAGLVVPAAAVSRANRVVASELADPAEPDRAAAGLRHPRPRGSPAGPVVAVGGRRSGVIGD